MKIDRKDYGTGNDSLELKAGSKRHQHIVGFENPKNGQTRFALVALDLPAGVGQELREERLRELRSGVFRVRLWGIGHGCGICWTVRPCYDLQFQQTESTLPIRPEIFDASENASPLARSPSGCGACSSCCRQAKSSAAPPAATDPYAEVQPATETLDLNMYQRIRDEGLNHSHVMEFATALMDGIGPRLTGSPNLAKANAWTRDTLTKIGLENAHLEDWGEFGLGWQQLNTWARMVTPDTAVLIVQATPWSPATPGPVTGDVVFVSIQTKRTSTNTRASWPARWFCLAPCARFRRWTRHSSSATPTRIWTISPSFR